MRTNKEARYRVADQHCPLPTSVKTLRGEMGRENSAVGGHIFLVEDTEPLMTQITIVRKSVKRDTFSLAPASCITAVESRTPWHYLLLVDQQRFCKDVMHEPIEQNSITPSMETRVTLSKLSLSLGDTSVYSLTSDKNQQHVAQLVTK